MLFYTLITKEKTNEIPPLNHWGIAQADNYEAAAIIAIKKIVPWEGMISVHVHKVTDPKHTNGMPLTCHSFNMEVTR
jgi:hypothetical protein